MVNNIIQTSHFDLSLSRLGLGEYSEVLESHGFDSWDNLSHINEVTMAELGIRLDHRRKLRREITSLRGQPRTQPLLSPEPVDGELRNSEEKPQSPHTGQDELEIRIEPTQLKRRYRHRQRKDPHAPRKPSCDYVLFGNSLRQQPDIAQLSFVEISKLVGEQWQQLSLEGRATWTSNAAEQKRKYITELAEYQQSKEYQHHQDYLRTTKAKQEQRGSNGEISPTASLEKTESPEIGSSGQNSKDSSITMAESENGKKFMVFVSRPE
jgi:hypothetical protein